MPKPRTPRPDPDPGPEMPPAQRAAMIADLRRVFIQNKWRIRQQERDRGCPSIGLALVRTSEQKVTPRYGPNNPLRYQKTNEADDRLDQSGSRL